MAQVWKILMQLGVYIWYIQQKGHIKSIWNQQIQRDCQKDGNGPDCMVLVSAKYVIHFLPGSYKI
jgi:hypothetical protein